MNIFRQLRWKLTLSYTLVTVGAFLVVMLILAGLVLTQIFIPEDFFSPEQLIKIIQNNTTPLWSHVLSQSPVDIKLVDKLLQSSDSTITSLDFLSIGSIKFSVKTASFLRALVIGADGTLFGTLHGGTYEYGIGKPFDPTRVPGLEAPLNAALAGETDASRLYTIIKPNEEFILAIPVFHTSDNNHQEIVGAIVTLFYAFPTQGDIPTHILNVAGRSLILFIIGVGIMGAIFGSIFAHGLSTRFKHISTATDHWSEGDFSRYIDDNTGDEISQISRHLNNMARQLQNLLRRRQEMAISEERNRLARDLHDSAKQGALAASFELGTVLTLFDSDPQGAKNHLVEADTLVDGVRKELTNLVHELRPQSMDELDFSDTLNEYAMDWSHRNGIELAINIDGNGELSVETRETLFRIAQEALANTARHSAARHVDLSLEFVTDTVTMVIHDDGHGFATDVQHSGLGLYSMRERAEALGGSLQVDSEPGQGTRIVVTLPRGNDQEEE